MPRAATPALTALAAAGIDHEVLSYRPEEHGGSFGATAAAELSRTAGIPAAQIFKTLVLALPRGAGVAVIPVPATLSLKAAAAALVVPQARLADPVVAQRRTGYVLGGISPLGQRSRLPMALDATAMRWDRILVSAGRRGLQVSLSPADLAAATGAVVAELCRADPGGPLSPPAR